MSRTGTRPHTWKVQGETAHTQSIAWMRAKAQAKYRGEAWLLSFDDYQQLWQGYWDRRGRSSTAYVMMRDDHQGAWERGNVQVTQRYQYLCRQRQYRGY